MLIFLVYLITCFRPLYVTGSTKPPILACAQNDVSVLIKKDFCTSGNQTVYRPDHCFVPKSHSAGAAATPGAPAVKCVKDLTIIIGPSDIKECPPNWTLKKHTYVCKFNLNYFVTDGKTDICRIPALHHVGRKIADCPKDLLIAEGLRKCAPDVLKSSKLVQSMCRDHESGFQLKPRTGAKCSLQQNQLPVIVKAMLLPMESCNKTAFDDEQFGIDDEQFGSPANFDVAIATCLPAYKFQASTYRLETCTYRGIVLLWDDRPGLQKVCKKVMKNIRYYDTCDRETVAFVSKILELAVRDVQTELIPACPPEIQHVNTKVVHTCFYRQELYYKWWRNRDVVCKLYQKISDLTYSKWLYCDEDAVNIMQDQVKRTNMQTTGTKRRASAAMTLLELSQRPEKSQKFYEDLEDEIRSWVQDGFNYTSTKVRNLDFTQQVKPRDVRAAENTSLQILRIPRQTFDSIRVEFTVVVDSRQVQGIDFAAELERSMKENAHKFGGPEGNFQIDPNSINVQEVIEVKKDEITTTSTSDGSRSIIITFLCTAGGIFVATLAGFVVIKKCFSVNRHAPNPAWPARSHDVTRVFMRRRHF